jgi:hypothetical protein
MARPKSSKNKTAEPAGAETQDSAAEFNYEDSDSLYQQVMSKGAVATAFDDTVPTSDFEPAPVTAAAVVTSSTFLVEGKVRLDQEGNSPVFADQRRIVNAANADEALSKFVNYFTSMSNATQRYTVVQAGASETIL